MKNYTKKLLCFTLIIAMFLTCSGFNYIEPYYTGIPAPLEGVTVRFVVPESSGFKSFMDYRKITNKRSFQYRLQSMEEMETSTEGIRVIKGRYCLAIGTQFNAHIGQLFDVVLENGTVIGCCVGDIKADQDTDANNVFSKNGCCSEFIVQTEYLPQNVSESGDFSNLCEEWDSPVYAIDVYDLFIDEI